MTACRQTHKRLVSGEALCLQAQKLRDVLQVVAGCALAQLVEQGDMMPMTGTMGGWSYLYGLIWIVILAVVADGALAGNARSGANGAAARRHRAITRPASVAVIRALRSEPGPA